MIVWCDVCRYAELSSYVSIRTPSHVQSANETTKKGGKTEQAVLVTLSGEEKPDETGENSNSSYHLSLYLLDLTKDNR